MTEEILDIARGLSHKIERVTKELKEIQMYGGNKWFISYGQDSQSSRDIKPTTEQFDAFIKLMTELKQEELNTLQKEFDSL